MFIGHFGFGLGAKKFASKVSLGFLFMAVQWADLLWPVMLLIGVEHVAFQPGNSKFPFNFTDYPITHSLLMGIVWGACFGCIYWLVKKDARGTLVLAICVVSHWMLDLVVHNPDLPFSPGNSPKVGFGLWNDPLLTAVVEGVLFIVGSVFYLQATQAKNAAGKWGFWVLALLLVLMHVVGKFSPLPGSVTALGWAAQYQWIFILLGFWVDRNRMPN
jgi:hypothetical protein